jgi:hypothetical protein
MDYHIATFPFVHSPINPSDIMNQALVILLILSFLSGAFGSQFHWHKDLEKQLEVAHFHQSVLEEDKAQLEDCIDFLLQKQEGTSPPKPGGILDEIIVGTLRFSSKNVREILGAIKPAFPDIEKSEINSRLYAMSNKGITKFERVSGEKAPRWSLITIPNG